MGRAPCMHSCCIQRAGPSSSEYIPPLKFTTLHRTMHLMNIFFYCDFLMFGSLLFHWSIKLYISSYMFSHVSHQPKHRETGPPKLSVPLRNANMYITGARWCLGIGAGVRPPSRRCVCPHISSSVMQRRSFHLSPRSQKHFDSTARDAM